MFSWCLIFAPKHRLWVLVRAAYVLSKNKKKYQIFSAENLLFLKLKKSLFIAWTSVRKIPPKQIGIEHAVEVKHEPVYEKTNNLGFWSGPTQTRLYIYRKKLEAWNFWYKQKRNCAVSVWRKQRRWTAVTARLIFVFCFRICKLLVFSREGSWFDGMQDIRVKLCNILGDYKVTWSPWKSFNLEVILLTSDTKTLSISFWWTVNSTLQNSVFSSAPVYKMRNAEQSPARTFNVHTQSQKT